MLNTNLLSRLFGATRLREYGETRRAWRETESRWRKSELSSRDDGEVAVAIVAKEIAHFARPPAPAFQEALVTATIQLLAWEEIGPLEINWSTIKSDPIAAIRFREMLARRRRWADDYHGALAAFSQTLGQAFGPIVEALPETLIGESSVGGPTFEVPLIELVAQPAMLIEQQILAIFDRLRPELFARLRRSLEGNLHTASGLQPSSNLREHARRLVLPRAQKGKSAAELAEIYLAGTPLADVFEVPIPFYVPEESRFEHCHIIGGTGHGKTQLMQRMIHADLVKAKWEKRSVVVIDSQGDLINKLMRLDLFDPDAYRSLADRLVIIDPADVEFPAALNLFDAHLDRVGDYRPVDRERVLNGVIELYETFFGAMLGAELTQKQGVIFRYLARLMLSIPGATIHTLMQLMDDGKPFKRYMEALDGSARYFFETEFFHPSFGATKKQILKRLWGVLSTPAFERMFAQPTNKLDLFEAMNDGKIVLISTAKDLLKSDGSSLLGRFFIALLAQAALERSTIDEDKRTPTFVYVDEAQEYFDDSIETILNQARKYKVGITLAHQTLDQLTPRLRSALNANTSFKCVGGVSAKDARALADEMRTTSDFIEQMRRRAERTEFAVWLKHQTPQAIRLTVPIGFLERQPILTEEAFEAILEQNRERYCGTLDDVVGLSFMQRSVADAEGDDAEESTPRNFDQQTGTEAVRGQEPVAESLRPFDGPNVADEEPRPARRPPRPAPIQLGKGGPQHRYVQSLIKGLAEERGFRAIVEEAIDGGQVDVSLRRADLTIACEVSVTTKPEHEAQNIAKCLRGGFQRVWTISPDAKRKRQIEDAARRRLADTDLARVDFLVMTDVIPALDALEAPATDETVVRGYRVKVSRTLVSAEEAEERRAAIARIVGRSLKDVGRST